MHIATAKQEKACSFLKKRTKRLLHRFAVFSCKREAKQIKVFLLLFLQKKKILSCLTTYEITESA